MDDLLPDTPPPPPGTRWPLAVTTSDRVAPELAERARAAAREVSVPYLQRTHKRPLSQMLRESAEALVVLEHEAVSLVDAQGALRFSPGLAHLRIKQLDAGVQEDMLLRVGALREGERVLDCTLGLGADAQVAARLVGPTGHVTALEKSPALYLLARHGLAGLPRHPRACDIQVLHADAGAHLRTLPAGAFDDPSWITADRYKFRHVFLRSRREWSDLSPHVEQYERHFRS